MDFSSPHGSESSVVAQNIGEQDITLNNTNTPQPVLASTAHKEKVNRDLLERIQQFSAMAGSYVESSGSDKRDSGDDKDFHFLDFLKQSHSNSSGHSSKPSMNEFPQSSEDSSLSMLDLEAIPDPGSLVHVDSDVSLGSWFGDLVPKKSKDDRPSVNPNEHFLNPEMSSREVSPGEKLSSAEQSRMASRYFMSESQLGGQYSDSPFGTPSRSFGNSMRQPTPKDNRSPESTVPQKEIPQNPVEGAAASSIQLDAFALEEEDEREVGSTLNFSDIEYQGALNMQQEFFESEQFAGDAADVLAKDEEIFDEEHKLMMNSGDEEEVTGTGFTTVAESQLFEDAEPKMSIGTYMAARSGKMERPSFGMKIRTPSPRKPYPLQRSGKTDNTYIAEEGENSTTREIAEEDDCHHDGTITEDNHLADVIGQDSKLKEPDENDNNETQDTTIEPSMLSLSEAIMNMSTSVNNEELARAIIEISKKKKQEKMKKGEKKQQSCQETSNDDQPKERRSSKLPKQSEDSKRGARGSKIPLGTKSPSPPKPVRMSYQKKSLDGGRSSSSIVKPQRQSQNRRPQSAKTQEIPATKNVRQSKTSIAMREHDQMDSAAKQEKAPPLRSVENVSHLSKSLPEKSMKDSTIQRPKMEKETVTTDPVPTKAAEMKNSNLEGLKTIFVSPEFEQLKTSNPITEESFMQDAPEHDDDVVEKSASEQEELPTFNNGRDSVIFPDEVSTKYLLSSTRTDLSLTRGSLSRESIEMLHRKLRIRGNRDGSEQKENAVVSPPVERFHSEKKKIPDDDDHPVKKLEKDTTWKSKDPDSRESVAPLSQLSPSDWKSSSRYSGEFQQMLPSMSFNEMATIQEHQFDHQDLEDKDDEERHIQSIPKLDAIKEEEAETTQDTTLSGQSTASGDSQMGSEISHPSQHSLPPHLQMMGPPQHLYQPMHHVMFRPPSALSSATLPGPYTTSDVHYRQHLDRHFHTLPADYHVRPPTAVYPHSFGPYPIPGSYAPHSVLHSTTTPMGYSIDQPSLASNAEMGLNHTTSTMYPQSGYHLHPGVGLPPRSNTMDGRFPSVPESCYHQSQFRPTEASISVPAELTFPGVRCVSLLSNTKLPLTNKSDRWMQVELNIVSPAIDCCFSLEAKPLVGPHDTKTVEISFSPKKEGRFEALLEVISYPVTSEGTMLQNARSAPMMVNLKAVAENANAEFLGPEDKNEMNFGETLCDTSKYLPLRISNKGAAEIPVCVILCTKSQDRKCFAISYSSAMDWNEQEKRSQSILRTVVLPGLRATTLWVHCRIPPKYCDAAEPPKSLSAQVYMEVDNSQKQSLDTVVLDSIPVEVTACVAKLHAPKNMQPLNFSCSKESSQSHNLPVKNCGNVASRVTFSLLEHTDVFTLSPQHALLAAGEHVQVAIRFAPSGITPSRLSSTLIMKIEPNGTKYEILINAECMEAGSGRFSQQSFPDTHSSISDMPSLLTNKSHVCWGGVPVGHSLQQRVVLRTSNGARKPLPMRVMIKGEDVGSFQILREDDREQEELCTKQEIVMRPGQDKIIKILFGPTRCKMALAKLEIKAPVDQVPSTKFTIPLSGYGGKTEVKIEGLESASEENSDASNRFFAFAEPLRTNDSKLQTKFTVRNNSSRHAFVKSILHGDHDCQSVLQDASASFSPSQFVLPKHSSRAVTLTIQQNFSTNRSSHSRNGRNLVACICLWHGDEISRHLLKNALAKLGPSAINKSLSESNPLRSVSFDGIFEGEGSHDPEEELSQVKPQLGDVQVFYSGIKKSIIEVFGPKSNKALLEMVEPGKKASRGSSVDSKTDLDRDFASSHQHFKRTYQSDSNDDSWQLSPEHVILSAPRTNSTSEPSKIKIINRSSTVLRFDVAWSGHFLTITPHSGRVDSESVLVMLINANPSLATRRDVLPWIGTVQISTQDSRGTKQLRVQIRDDVAALDASVQPATPVPRVPLKAHFSDHPSLDSFSTPMAAAAGLSRISAPSKDTHLGKIKLNSATVDFGQAPVKSSAKSHLEFTNVCPSSIRWLLTSFAPAYVKDVEPAGDLYRSTYAAFVFSHTSGLLEPGAKVQIPVSFNPMSEGNYSQFWDLEHHEAADSAALSLNKIRIQVVGQGIKSNRPILAMPSSVTNKSKDGHGIYVSDEQVRFPDTSINDSALLKIPVKNKTKESHNVRFINVRTPFHITHQRHTIRPMSYACLPVTFKPTARGHFEGTLIIQTEGTYSLSVKLLGRGV